jgi:hypothetical protein
LDKSSKAYKANTQNQLDNRTSPHSLHSLDRQGKVNWVLVKDESQSDWASNFFKLPNYAKITRTNAVRFFEAQQMRLFR